MVKMESSKPLSEEIYSDDSRRILHDQDFEEPRELRKATHPCSDGFFSGCPALWITNHGRVPETRMASELSRI